jgi:hypothetical protein
MPGAQVIELVISWGVTTALTFLLVIVDTRHLTEEQLERAWTPVSRDAAVAWLGVFALPFHFAKTRGTWEDIPGARRRIRWFFIGIVIALVVALASGLVITAIAWAIGLPLSE